jgi:cytochrome c556
MVLKHSMRIGFVSVVLVFGGPGVAHDAHDPRHHAMESMGKHMKELRRTAEGAATLGSGALSLARALKERAKELLSLFPESSRGRKGSREKPEIWSDWSGFSAAAVDLEEAADRLVAAAASGDRARLAAALKRAGDECIACHDRYRAPK